MLSSSSTAKSWSVSQTRADVSHGGLYPRPYIAIVQKKASYDKQEYPALIGREGSDWRHTKHTCWQYEKRLQQDGAVCACGLFNGLKELSFARVVIPLIAFIWGV